MKRGFTLLELMMTLVIIGIVAGAVAVGVGAHLRAGERERARHVVSEAATALSKLFLRDGVWPKQIRELGANGGKLDENVAWCLRDDYSLTVSDDENQTKTIGSDRFGIVTPWAADVIKRLGTKASLSSKVGSGGTVEDHIVRFAVDLDGDGIIENVPVGGESVSVRATAIAWSCNQDGEIEAYSDGLKKDGIYSWSKGQATNVK